MNTYFLKDYYVIWFSLKSFLQVNGGMVCSLACTTIYISTKKNKLKYTLENFKSSFIFFKGQL